MSSPWSLVRWCVQPLPMFPGASHTLCGPGSTSALPPCCPPWSCCWVTVPSCVVSFNQHLCVVSSFKHMVQQPRWAVWQLSCLQWAHCSWSPQLLCLFTSSIMSCCSFMQMLFRELNSVCYGHVSASYSTPTMLLTSCSTSLVDHASGVNFWRWYVHGNLNTVQPDLNGTHLQVLRAHGKTNRIQPAATASSDRPHQEMADTTDQRIMKDTPTPHTTSSCRHTWGSRYIFIVWSVVLIPPQY